MSGVARYAWSDRLARIVERGDAAAERLAAAPPDRRAAVAATARRVQARASARLDASPLEDATAERVDEAGGTAPLVPESAGAEAVRGGWARALRLDSLPSQDIAAVEYANLVGLSEHEPRLARRVLDAPLEVLVEVHGHVCDGLVAPEAIGRPRRSEQDVHDGAQGQVIYRGAAAETLPDRLAALAAWLVRNSDDEPALVVAGVVHERLLEWQPFEAANGRVARATARLVRRARGLDPDGAATPEPELAADALGYAREVGATVRRRGDLTRWLERDAEVTVRALEDAVDAAWGTAPPAAPPHAVSLAAELGPDFTVTEYADAAGLSRDAARADLEALERARVIRPEPGTGGLRVRVCPPAGGAAG